MSISAYLLTMCFYSISGAIYFFNGMNSYKEGKYFWAGMWFNVWLFHLIYLAKLILEY